MVPFTVTAKLPAEIVVPAVVKAQGSALIVSVRSATV